MAIPCLCSQLELVLSLDSAETSNLVLLIFKRLLLFYFKIVLFYFLRGNYALASRCAFGTLAVLLYSLFSPGNPKCFPDGTFCTLFLSISCFVSFWPLTSNISISQVPSHRQHVDPAWSSVTTDLRGSVPSSLLLQEQAENTPGTDMKKLSMISILFLNLCVSCSGVLARAYTDQRGL